MREGGRLARRFGEILVVRRDGGAQAGLELRVDAPHLALLRDRAEPPERGRRRQEREQDEVRDELELEASRRRSNQVSPLGRRYLIWVISAATGSSMRGIVWRTLALVAAAVGLAAAFVVPLRAAGSAPLPGPTVQMPPARLQTTVSVFPAPGRPESAPGPVLRPHVPK